MPLATGQQPAFAMLATDQDRVYWLNGDRNTLGECNTSIRSVAKAGGAVTTHITTADSKDPKQKCEFISAFAVDGGTLYLAYLSGDVKKRRVVRLAPGATEPVHFFGDAEWTATGLADRPGEIAQIVVGPAHVYIHAGSAVVRLSKAGGAAAKVADGLGRTSVILRPLALDGDTLYIGGEGIRAVPVAGGAARQLFPPPSGGSAQEEGRHVQSLGGRVYWTNTVDAVSSMPLAGGAKMVHEKDAGMPMIVHQGAIYYGQNGRVNYADPARETTTNFLNKDTIAMAQGRVMGLASDGTSLFFSISSGAKQGTIERAQ